MNKNPVKSNTTPLPGSVQAKPGSTPDEHRGGSRGQSPQTGRDKGGATTSSSPKIVTPKATEE